jgi:hypothetical protein
MQRLDHVAKFVNGTEGISPGAISVMGREEGQWRVAPVVDAPRRTVLSIELEHGQKLYCGDAQSLEIWNLFDEPCERASRLFADTGARMAGEAAHVQFVDNGLRRGVLQWRIAPPVVRGDIEHDALHRRLRVVARVARLVTTVRLWHDYATTVGVEENLAGIEAHPARGIERTLHPIAVQLAGSYVRHAHVPVVVRAVGRWIEGNDARCARVIHPIEQQQLDSGRVLRKDTEVDAAIRRPGSQRRTAAFVETAAHDLPSSSLAAAATRPGWNPNFSCSAFSGAEAPNVFMPMMRPALPT